MFLLDFRFFFVTDFVKEIGENIHFKKNFLSFKILMIFFSLKVLLI